MRSRVLILFSITQLDDKKEMVYWFEGHKVEKLFKYQTTRWQKEMVNWFVVHEVKNLL